MSENTNSGKLEPRRTLEQPDDWRFHAAMADKLARQLEEARDAVIAQFDGDLPMPSEAAVNLPVPSGGVNLPVSSGAVDLQKLRENQRKALVALSEGLNYGQSALKAGVDSRTLYRWMKKDPDFAAALANIRERAVESAWDRLKSGAQSAAATLVKASQDGDTRAALALLKLVEPAPRKQAEVSLLETLLPPGSGVEVQMRLRELLISLASEPAKSPVSTPERRNVSDDPLEK